MDFSEAHDDNAGDGGGDGNGGGGGRRRKHTYAAKGKDERQVKRRKWREMGREETESRLREAAAASAAAAAAAAAGGGIRSSSRSRKKQRRIAGGGGGKSSSNAPSSLEALGMAAPNTDAGGPAAASSSAAAASSPASAVMPSAGTTRRKGPDEAAGESDPDDSAASADDEDDASVEEQEKERGRQEVDQISSSSDDEYDDDDDRAGEIHNADRYRERQQGLLDDSDTNGGAGGTSTGRSSVLVDLQADENCDDDDEGSSPAIRKSKHRQYARGDRKRTIGDEDEEDDIDEDEDDRSELDVGNGEEETARRKKQQQQEMDLFSTSTLGGHLANAPSSSSATNTSQRPRPIGTNTVARNNSRPSSSKPPQQWKSQSTVSASETLTDPVDSSMLGSTSREGDSAVILHQVKAKGKTTTTTTTANASKRSSPYRTMNRSSELETSDRSSDIGDGGFGGSNPSPNIGDSDDDYEPDDEDDDGGGGGYVDISDVGTSRTSRTRSSRRLHRPEMPPPSTTVNADDDEENEFSDDEDDNDDEGDRRSSLFDSEIEKNTAPRRASSSNRKRYDAKSASADADAANMVEMAGSGGADDDGTTTGEKDSAPASVAALESTPKVVQNEGGSNITPKVHSQSLTQAGREKLIKGKKNRKKNRSRVTPSVLPRSPERGDSDVDDSLTFHSGTGGVEAAQAEIDHGRRDIGYGRPVRDSRKPEFKTIEAEKKEATATTKPRQLRDVRGRVRSKDFDDRIEGLHDSSADGIADSSDNEVEGADNDVLVGKSNRGRLVAPVHSTLEAVLERQETISWNDDVTSVGRKTRKRKQRNNEADVGDRGNVNNSAGVRADKSRSSDTKRDSVLVRHGQAQKPVKGDVDEIAGTLLDLNKFWRQQRRDAAKPVKGNQQLLHGADHGCDGNANDSSCLYPGERRKDQMRGNQTLSSVCDEEKAKERRGRGGQWASKTVTKPNKSDLEAKSEATAGAMARCKVDKESEKILPTIVRLDALCKGVPGMNQEESLAQQAAAFQQLSKLRSSFAAAPKSFEAVMAEENGVEVANTFVASLNCILGLALDSNEISARDRRKRLSAVCTCLHFFVDASSLVGLINHISRIDQPPIFSAGMRSVLSHPEIVWRLLRTVREGWDISTRSNMEESEKRLRLKAVMLAIACLAAADPHFFVDKYFLSDCDAESGDRNSVTEDLHHVAGSLQRISSYPEVEIVLLFLVGIRRSLLLALFGNDSGNFSRDILRRFDKSFASIYRKKLSYLDMQLQEKDVARGQGSKLSFCAWARECAKSREKAIIFDCNGVYNPKNDDEVGSKIGAIESIQVNAATPGDALASLSFYVVDPSTKDNSTLRTIDASLTADSSETSTSSQLGRLAVEDIYRGTKLVQIRFDDCVKSADHAEDAKTRPVVYSSEHGAITMHLSPEGMRKSNLTEVLRQADNCTYDTFPSVTGNGNDLVNIPSVERNQSNLIRLQVKKDQFQAFCQALTECGVEVVEQTDTKPAKAPAEAECGHEQDNFGGRDSSAGAIIDHVEFTTRRIHPARLLAQEDAQSHEPHSTRQPQISSNASETNETVAQDGGEEERKDAENMAGGIKEMDGQGVPENAQSSANSAGTQSSELSKLQNRRVANGSKMSRENMVKHSVNRSKSPSTLAGKRKRDNDSEEEEEDLGANEVAASDSPDDAQIGDRKQMEGGLSTETDNREKTTREVTPLPLGASVHKQTSTTASPLGFAVNHNQPPQCLDAKFSRVERSPNSLESISARCCAMLAVKGSRTREGVLKVERPLPISQIDGENNLEEDVIAYDQALLRAVDALYVVNRLAKKIETICGATSSATSSPDAGTAPETAPNDATESAFGWIDGPYQVLHSKQQQWASQRKEVEKQLHEILVQELTKNAGPQAQNNAEQGGGKG